MRKILLAIGLCLLITTSLQAEEQGIEVRPAGKELIETEPKKIVTTVFYVTNKTLTRQEFTSETEFPSGWVLITKDFPFELGAGETEIRLVSFFISQRALAGRYQITYSVKGRNFPSISDFCTIHVVVLPVRKLEVRLLESPQYVIAGEDYSVSFVLINESNIENTVRVKIDSAENLPFFIDTKNFKLAPAEYRTLKVVVKTSAEIRKLLKHRLQLTAQISEDETIKTQASSFVEIIPRITGVEEYFHRIPGEIAFKWVGQKDEDEQSGFQTEIFGGGTLDEEGKKHIEFLFREPDILDKSVFGLRDEYYFTYWTKDCMIHFGDGTYSLSPLTENNRYGRGAKGKLNLNGLDLGAYHTKTRWLEPGEKQTAGYIGYSNSEKYRVALNYLSKEGSTSNEIVSLYGQFSPWQNIDVELEYAYGKKNKGNDTKSDNAYLLRVQGLTAHPFHSWISYFLRYIHAGSKYSGYYSDVDSLSASLGVPLVKKVRLNAHFRQDKNNLDLNPTLHSAPLERYHQLGLDYRLETDTNLYLDYRERTRKDLLSQPRFDYAEKTYRLGLNHNFEELTLSASFEFGESRDKLVRQSTKLERYTLSTCFKPTNGQSHSAYLQYRDDSYSAGINSSLQIGERTFSHLNFRTNDYQESYHESRDILEIGLSHSLPNEHKISVQGHYTSYRNSEKKDETALMIQYTILFRLPVSRKKNIGVVKGYVYDEETKESMPDVIIRANGATAVTDRDGNFTFPSLKPGTHYLNIDSGRIGLNRITVQKNPIEVTVESGKETRIEIAITKSAILSGQIVLYQFENNHNNNLGQQKSRDNNTNHYVVGNGNNNNGFLNNGETKLVKAYGLANILVELTNGSEIKRCVADKKGYFRFEEIRPGKWTLKAYNDNLPEYHYLEENILVVELKPGGRKEVLARVLPKKRPILIIEEGGTLLEEEKIS